MLLPIWWTSWKTTQERKLTSSCITHVSTLMVTTQFGGTKSCLSINSFWFWLIQSSFWVNPKLVLPKNSIFTDFVISRQPVPVQVHEINHWKEKEGLEKFGYEKGEKKQPDTSKDRNLLSGTVCLLLGSASDHPLYLILKQQHQGRVSLSLS